MPSATTTAPGSASACSRAARFGVSPTTARSLASPRPDQVADHDGAGCDPDPGGEGAFGPGPGYAATAQAGTDRPLGGVLVRLGPAEVGEHAVAHVLGDVPLEAADLAPATAVLVGPENLAQSPPGRAGRRARSSRPGRRT